MAKGSNSLSGRRSSSRNTKPYDANNSFVKKVATKVTDLIPQRSWISKWFNSSQNEGDALDDTENAEEVESEEDIQKPPPLKRPCIRMDVTHPPGTFSIQPRVKSPVKVSPSKQQYSARNDRSEDFSEPIMAGPSGISHLVSSTPAIQTDIRNIASQRSELNSLVAPTNNGTANGMDDNSESSESTSGCSSLIPQTNRQEVPSNVSYSSPFSNRKRFHDDKLSFTNHAQSPRSLFLDSNTRDSLSSRRPSFSASVMLNTPDRASPLSSPFYSGNITFGGANAAALYKRGRNLFNSSNEIQLKVPRRTSVEVKPSTTAGVDSSGMSQTAKKILEALEHFSSPVTDAKKIPLKTINSTSSINKKRSREEATTTTKVGLRHLTRELTVPTVPDILRLRRRQKLQDTTVAARKIVSARTEPPPSQEYYLRTQDDDSKHHGKLKGKTANLDEEGTVEPVNLPNIPLPITSLPNFNFMSAANSKLGNKSCTDNEGIFTFASPIKVTDVTKNLKSINNFTFSNPINADKQSVNNSNESSSSLMKVSANSDTPLSNCIPTPTQNFIWSGSSTAPRPKEKVKNGDAVVPAISSELKSGSVMDVLGSKINKLESEKSSETNTETDFANQKLNAVAPDITKDNNITISKSDTLQDTLNMWECSECLIKNSNSETKCITCKTARPNPKTNKTYELPANNVSDSKTKNDDSFGSQFKVSSNHWESTSSRIKNKETDLKSVACGATKPDSKNEMNSRITKSINSDLNNSSEESWECSNCKLTNSSRCVTCPSCNLSKPTLVTPITAEDKSANNTNIVSNQKTGIATSTIVDNSNVAKSESMDKFKPSKDTWECPCCMVRNAASVDSCPCCNTAKPNAGAPTKTTQPNDNLVTLANGFGDKFKKPEGAWNCDTCMLQNDAKVTECVACGGLKPGSKKPESSTTNTGSKLQFNFGIPPSAGSFKFGIDKADSKADSAASTNGFKFGSNQPSNQIGQFTFGVQNEDKKTGNETVKCDNSTTVTSGSGFGFHVKTTTNEKTNAKQELEKEKKRTSSFSFGIPKSDNATAVANTSVSSTTPPTFAFGVPKPEDKQSDTEKEKQSSLLENTVTKVSNSNTKTTEAATTISGSTVIVAKSSSQEVKPISTFSFVVPSSTAAVSSSTTNTVTSLPSSVQSSFTFPETKSITPTTSAPTFGQATTSAPSLPPSTFTFGEKKISEGTSLPKTFGSLPSGSSGSSLFSNISSPPSLFSTSDAKTTSAFSKKENKQPTFVANANKPSAFAMPENKVPTFGSTENKPSIFGSTDTKLPVFGSSDKSTPLFNPTPQAPPATPPPTFGAPSATPNLFGSSATPVFGSNTSSTFPTEPASTIFSTTKANETAPAGSNLFTFGTTPAQPVAQPGTGFNFSANTNPTGNAQKPLFTFGGNSNAPPNNNLFGNTFNNPASNNTGFTFNAPKPETPAFGQPTVTSPIFGAPQPGSQEQPSSSFSSTPSNTGFNFGSVPPAAPSSGGFNFGGIAPASAPPTGFNFNAPSSTPTFDPTTPPSFNFTGGNAPPTFSGAPQTVTQRKFKKAFRRIR